MLHNLRHTHINPEPMDRVPLTDITAKPTAASSRLRAPAKHNVLSEADAAMNKIKKDASPTNKRKSDEMSTEALPSARVSKPRPASATAPVVSKVNTTLTVPAKQQPLFTSVKPIATTAAPSKAALAARKVAAVPATTTVRKPISRPAPVAAPVAPPKPVEEAPKMVPLAELQALQQSLDEANSRAGELSLMCDERAANIASMESNLQMLNSELVKSQALVKNTKEMSDKAAAAAARTQAELESAIAGLKSELAAEQATSAQLRASLSEQHQLVASLRLELAAIGERLVAALAECARQATELDCRQAEVQQKSANIETLEAKIRNDEQARKRLHNTIQELKGNIRVYARLRPPMVNEVVSEEVQFVCVPDTDYRQLEVCGASQKSADGLKTQQKRWQFEFDRVFGQEATQADVFEELSQLIQSSLDGYKVSIMSYGQTGSGKTFTMEGPTIDCKNDNAGMIPRAVEQIFDYCTALKSKGWNYSLEAMYVEIYNENIIDLLSAQADTEEGKHEIKHFAGGPAAKQETVVTGVVLQPVTCAGDVYPLLQRAKANRSVARTKCNERSSRSHSIFQLRINGTNTITELKSSGVLNLIDLAGSERLDKSGASGKQLEETKNINKSLSCLGDVIAALANKDKHVPFRNSTLTYLLQQCFDKDSKTLVFLNLAPEPEHLQESLCTLRFGAKANSAEIGTARKNVK